MPQSTRTTTVSALARGAGDEQAQRRARAALDPIEHIVVLMLENRSFDHTLGYLALPDFALEETGELPVKVNGLRLDDPQFVIQHQTGNYAPYPLDEAIFTRSQLDPPHGARHVAMQIAGGKMNGFVAAFADALAAHPHGVNASARDLLQMVMGYLTPEQVPVYDHLARLFCVCDRWFCSVPGPTMPNRFYALAGTSHGINDNKDLLVGEFGRFSSFFRHLDQSAWRWYSSDPGILRAVDSEFMFDNALDRFAYFEEYTERQPRSFLRDVLGDSEHPPALPSVAWIDPNFAMRHMLPQWAGPLFDGPGSNDDHPPAPVILGQSLVNRIYEALRRSQYWESCLFVVVYDEHGGFFDHEPPPDGKGPRVPALLISPHVKRGVCSESFDHASLIKTILLRFGGEADLDKMPSSVAAATDLSVAIRDDGATVAYSPVPNPGLASVNAEDLQPKPLPPEGSTLGNAVGFTDDQMTDLQKDVVYAIAVPLRTGFRSFRRIRYSKLLRLLLPLLARVRRRRPDRRVEPRRP